MDSGVAVAEAAVGDGRLVLCGPQVLFRGQPDGMFKSCSTWSRRRAGSRIPTRRKLVKTRGPKKTDIS
jgi:hypothetical protein